MRSVATDTGLGTTSTTNENGIQPRDHSIARRRRKDDIRQMGRIRTMNGGTYTSLLSNPSDVINWASILQQRDTPTTALPITCITWAVDRRDEAGLPSGQHVGHSRMSEMSK